MKIKIDSGLSSDAAEALARHARPLHGDLGARVIGIVELKASEATNLAADEDREEWVKVKVTAIELANADQEDELRRAQRALYAIRTATGTLDEESDQLELEERTLDAIGGVLSEITAARLMAGIRYWAQQAASASRLETATPTELRHELERVRDGLGALLAGGEVPE